MLRPRTALTFIVSSSRISSRAFTCIALTLIRLVGFHMSPSDYNLIGNDFDNEYFLMVCILPLIVVVICNWVVWGAEGIGEICQKMIQTLGDVFKKIKYPSQCRLVCIHLFEKLIHRSLLQKQTKLCGSHHNDKEPINIVTVAPFHQMQSIGHSKKQILVWWMHSQKHWPPTCCVSNTVPSQIKTALGIIA